MKSDLQKYIEDRKPCEAEFAAGLDAGYAEFKISVLLHWWKPVDVRKWIGRRAVPR